MILLKVDIEPVAKSRPRFTREGRAYTPKKTRVFEGSIRSALTETYPDLEPYPRDTALSVYATFAKSVPKSYSKKDREKCLSGMMAPAKKPDVDNYLKAVLDALNGIAFEDDSQIVNIYAEKIYAESPYVMLTIRRVGE